MFTEFNQGGKGLISLQFLTKLYLNSPELIILLPYNPVSRVFCFGILT